MPKLGTLSLRARVQRQNDLRLRGLDLSRLRISIRLRQDFRAIGKRAIGSALFAWATVTAASAQNYDPGSGIYWLGLCKSEQTAALCATYLRGIVETQSFHEATALQEGNSSYRPLWCLPAGVPYGQLRLVVVNWMERHPEELHRRIFTLAASALIEAFPCPLPR